MLLGNATSSGHLREVWFDPQDPAQPLSNPHISISGETGSGKTQAVKAILHDFLPQGLPALILDFKDDYSKADFARREGFTVHDASYGSLPFNPMVPPVDPQRRAGPIRSPMSTTRRTCSSASTSWETNRPSSFGRR